MSSSNDSIYDFMQFYRVDDLTVEDDLLSSCCSTQSFFEDSSIENSYCIIPSPNEVNEQLERINVRLVVSNWILLYLIEYRTEPAKESTRQYSCMGPLCAPQSPRRPVT